MRGSGGVCLPCDFFAGPASSPEVMEEEEVDPADPLFLCSFLVSFFFLLCAPPGLHCPEESLLGTRLQLGTGAAPNEGSGQEKSSGTRKTDCS